MLVMPIELLEVKNMNKQDIFFTPVPYSGTKKLVVNMDKFSLCA